MIDQIYINEAKRIRKEYLDNLLFITNEEKNIIKLTTDLKKISDEIEESEIKNESYYKKVLTKIETMIQKTTDKIIPYQTKSEELDKQQRILYNTIKEKYPKISNDEIQNDIIPHIIKVDETYKKKHKNMLT